MCLRARVRKEMLHSQLCVYTGLWWIISPLKPHPGRLPRLGRIGRENRGSRKSEIKVKVTGLYMVTWFAASKVFSHTLSCFESNSNPGGIESRCSITYILERKTEKRHLPRCQGHSGCSINSFIDSMCYWCSVNIWGMNTCGSEAWSDSSRAEESLKLGLSCSALHDTKLHLQLWTFLTPSWTRVFKFGDLRSPLHERGTSQACQPWRKFLRQCLLALETIRSCIERFCYSSNLFQKSMPWAHTHKKIAQEKKKLPQELANDSWIIHTAPIPFCYLQWHVKLIQGGRRTFHCLSRVEVKILPFC